MGPMDYYLNQRAANRDAARKVETAQQIADAKVGAARQINEDRAAAAAAAQAQRDATSALTKKMSAPETRRVSRGDSDAAIVVTHWRAPAAPVPGGKAPGPLWLLPPGGGVTAAPLVLATAHPELTGDPEFKQWVDTLKPLLAETKTRYPLLDRLRHQERWGGMCSSIGLGIERTKPESWQHGELSGTRQVTTVSLPVVTDVKITPDGLRILIKYRPDDSIDRWVRALPKLRAALGTTGVDARNLRVQEVPGGFVLVFDDAPAVFPRGVSLEPPEEVVATKSEAITRYARTRWQLGLDAYGNPVSYALETQPHVLVTGGTGGGKSVWARSLIEFLRTGYRTPDDKDAGGGWTIFVGDGKGSDFAALEGLPGIAMVTPGDDPAQTAVMVRLVRVETERRFAEAKAAKKRGDTSAFSKMGPILLLLDEWGSTAIKMTGQYGKTAAAFLSDIDLILRLGREARVHCVLLSQTIRKTGDGAVPGSWQENLGLTVSLGPPSEITLQSDAFTAETRDRAAFLGARLQGKQGRGITVERESGKVIEFQSFYGWSPGTTSLEKGADKKISPPTPELRETWQRWVPVSESVPWLAPRIGIKAEDSSWREGDLGDVANTPTIALTDRDGAMKPGYGKYDPASEAWLGAVDPTASGHEYAELDFDGGSDRSSPPPPPSTPRAESVDEFEPVEEKSSPLDVSAMTPEQRDQLLTQLLRRPVVGTPETPEPEPSSEQKPEPPTTGITTKGSLDD